MTIQPALCLLGFSLLWVFVSLSRFLLVAFSARQLPIFLIVWPMLWGYPFVLSFQKLLEYFARQLLQSSVPHLSTDHLPSCFLSSSLSAPLLQEV